MCIAYLDTQHIFYRFWRHFRPTYSNNFLKIPQHHFRFSLILLSMMIRATTTVLDSEARPLTRQRHTVARKEFEELLKQAWIEDRRHPSDCIVSRGCPGDWDNQATGSGSYTSDISSTRCTASRIRRCFRHCHRCWPSAPLNFFSKQLNPLN